MNNFDESSSGTNIELTVSYDNDLAQFYYQDFENENTRLQFGRDSSVLLLGDSSNPYYKKSELNKMTKAQLIELDDYFQLLHPNYTAECLKIEYIEELKNVTIKQYYEYLISEYTWYDLRDNITHDYYISNGYSQGDATYIISLDEELTDGYKKSIDNILWDIPVYISLTVNDVEYRDDELLDDIYEYDKNLVIEEVKLLDIPQDAKEWIADNLPNEPKYDY